ncbi:MAG: hypothetical protein OSB19_04170 [Opitutaceae bacterium]|nr:hypothetical protein [Opitutaceae bacterium]
MRFSKYLSALALILAFATISYSAVKSPEERKDKIELSKRLLDRKIVLLTEETITLVGDPFSVSLKVVEGIVVVEESLSAQELMPILARNVKPTGIFAIGGEYYLMFKEMKIKSGGSVPVKYQNVEYNLEIVNILRNGYSLRFGDAEVEIKLK